MHRLIRVPLLLLINGYRNEAIVKILKKKDNIFVSIPEIKFLHMRNEDNPNGDYYIQKGWATALNIDKNIYAKKIFDYLKKFSSN